MRTMRLLASIVAGIALVGCLSFVRAPTTPDGGRLRVEVVTHPPITDETGERHAERLRTVGDYMEQDLVRSLSLAGYEAAAIEDPTAFQPGPGRYLLDVDINNYINAYAAVTLDTSYRVFGTSSDPVHTGSQSGTTSRGGWHSFGSGWQGLVRTIDQRILQDITEALARAIG